MVLCREDGVFGFVTVKSKYTYLFQQHDVKKVLNILGCMTNAAASSAAGIGCFLFPLLDQ
jgi:hypothetical protein